MLPRDTSIHSQRSSQGFFKRVNCALSRSAAFILKRRRKSTLLPRHNNTFSFFFSCRRVVHPGRHYSKLLASEKDRRASTEASFFFSSVALLIYGCTSSLRVFSLMICFSSPKLFISSDPCACCLDLCVGLRFVTHVCVVRAIKKKKKSDFLLRLR